MEYLTRIALEHQGIQEMLRVQRELNERLKKAKGVNIVHLENTLRFWRDFLAQEHMSWEEEFAFALLRKLNHGLPGRLQGDHARIETVLAKLEATMQPLRSGRPHAGREFVRWAEELVEAVAAHLARENAALQELKAQGETGVDPELLLETPAAERREPLVQMADALCREYLQTPSALLSLQEKTGAELEAEADEWHPDPTVEAGGAGALP